MRARSVRFWAGVVALFALLFCAPVRAEKPQAQDLYRQGEAAFTAGRFGEAAQSFERAYQESHRPRLLWNIAQSYRRQFEIDGDRTNLRRARVVLHNYVQVAESPADRAEGEKAEAEVAAQLVEAPQAPSPSAPVPEATTPAPQPAKDIAPPIDSHRTLRFAGYGLGAGGIVVAAVGLVLGLVAHSASQTVENASHSTPPMLFDSVAGDEQRGQRLSYASYACYGVGGAALVTGIVLEVLAHRRADRPVALLPAASGMAVAGSW